MKKLTRFSFLFVIAALALTTGCRKPYNKATYHTFENNVTGFAIQAEGDSEAQDMFKSPEMLAKGMVATKRYQIPRIWHQTGRKSWSGKWVDAVIIMEVNRTPVTRVWDADASKGSSTKNEALAAESKDSLFVSSGFTLTAMIEPDDAAKFLYKYKGGNLGSIVDSQVKNSIQTAFTDECAKYDLLELPEKKGLITAAIRAKVIPFYKAWGITLTADMGLVGGLTYTPEIQQEINDVFKAEKAKERAVAETAAQEEVNVKLKAMAQNEADMAKIKADGEAYAIGKKAEAIKAAGGAYIQSQFIEKWNGVMSKVSGGDSMSMLIGGSTLE